MSNLLKKFKMRINKNKVI